MLEWTDQPSSEAPAPSDAQPSEPQPGSASAPQAPPPTQQPPTQQPPTRTGTARGCVLELIQTLVATVVLFFIIQAFIAQPFQVQQTSMESTFHSGDYLIVDRLSHLWSPYTRGQVIVFQAPPAFPDGGKPLIKRIIGIAGDTIEIKDGRVYVNGTALDEPYLHRDDAGTIEPTEPLGAGSRWLIPAGQLFVMGDHRQVSSDSRAFGPIDASSVIGRGFLRYWPIDRFGLVFSATYDDLAAP